MNAPHPPVPLDDPAARDVRASGTVLRRAFSPEETEAIASVRGLYERGRFHEAHDASAALGDLRAWPGTDDRVLASRLAGRLGGGRLAQALVFRAGRDDPSHPAASLHYARLVYGRRGPWHALRHLRRLPPSIGALPKHVALEARCLSRLRDFERAHARLDEVTAADVGEAWLLTNRACLWIDEDRLEAALEATTAALAADPDAHLGRALHAHLLSRRGRAEEAYDALCGEVCAQSFELLLQRAEIAFGLGRGERCRDDLVRARDAARLADAPLTSHFDEREAEARYLLREHRRAEALARRAKGPVMARFADALAALEDGAPPPRVELSAVPHVPQRHASCAPASLASITAFFGSPVDQDEIEEAICYGGTRPEREREWAEARGYQVRELDLTEEVAHALIDRRVPFVLITTATVTAHAQVVIGYDRARGTLLIRDPSRPELAELGVHDLLEKNAAFGPRAMVMAPDTVDLSGIPLPNAELWDLRHRGRLAIARHAIDDARAAADELDARAPGSRHALEARLELARYRADDDAILACLDAMLALHPDTPAWVLQRGEAMRGRRPRHELLAHFGRHAHLDDYALLESYADELRLEPGRQEEAARLLGRALRLSPSSGMACYLHALLERQRHPDSEEALLSHRFATCLAETNEPFARAYFEHARALGRDDEALAHLERRAARAAARSAAPAQTLFEAYLDQGNPEKGVEVLERVARDRPEDGDLAVTLVHACLDAGDEASAARWLEASSALPARSEDRCAAAARLAHVAGDRAEARAQLERMVEIAPARVDGWARLARLVDELEGPDASVAILEAAHAARPHDGGLVRELAMALRGRDEARVVELLRAHLEEQPSDAWTRRELALALSALDRHDEAVSVAREARDRHPHDSYAFSVLGVALANAGAHDEAREAYRRAIALDVDNAAAIRELVRWAPSPEAAREDVRFVLARSSERQSQGAGLLQVIDESRVLAHDERVERMRELLARNDRRPDAWEALIAASLDAGELDEADALSSAARERFPRWFRLVRLRADVLRVRGEPAAEEEELRVLVRLAPADPVVRAELFAALAERGALDEAEAVLAEGLRRAPDDAVLCVARARLAWRRGRSDEAFDELVRVLRAGKPNGFDALTVWARQLGRGAEVESALRAVIAERDADATWWYRLGVFLQAPAERIDAFEAALARAPRFADAADALAIAFVDAGRFEDALAVCPPAAWTGPVPVTMRGRRAWVRAARGDREGALRDMEAVLEEDPSYTWGRLCACEWADGLGLVDAFVAHARALVEHAPTRASSHVFVADALSASGDRAGACAAFTRAIELDPSQAYAAYTLVSMHLEDGALDRAREVIERVRFSVGLDDAAALDARVALAEGAFDEALGALDVLLDAPAPSRPLRYVLELFGRTAHAKEAFSKVEARLLAADRPDDPELGSAWADAHAALGTEGRGLRLATRLGELDAGGQRGVARLIERLGQKRRGLALAWAWLRHRRALAACAQTWGAMGYALLELGWNALAARWLDPWDREGARPWMLLNAVVAAWIARGGAAARSIVAHALSLPRDHASDRHRVWDALHRALDGDALDAGAELEALEHVGDEVEEGLRALVRAMATAEEEADTPIGALVALLDHDLTLAANRARRHADLRQPYDAALERILAGRPWIVRAWVRAFRLPSR